MTTKVLLIAATAALIFQTGVKAMEKKVAIYVAASGKIEMLDPVVKTDEEWKKLLTPEQFEAFEEARAESARRLLAGRRSGFHRRRSWSHSQYRE